LSRAGHRSAERFGDPRVTGREEKLKTLAAEEAFLFFPRPVHADFSI
jgi:hypothetical protein